MPVENYKPLSCGSFGFLSLLSIASDAKKKHGGYRAGAGRKPKDKQPKSAKLCRSCSAEFAGRGNFCEDHKGGICNHEKPIFSNGKPRLACFACAPKPESAPRKAYEFKSKKDSSCECCGLMFEKTQHHNKFCSDVCRNRVNNVSKQSKRGDRAERSCRCCGVFFTPEYGNKNKLQCSEECRAAYQAKSRYASMKQRIASDPVERLKRSMRTFICQSIIRGGYKKKSRAHEILGCDWSIFRRHIEKQFKPGMTWDRRSEWHIDHIVPMASAANETEALALNHFTNLQPLWAIDNLRKGSKVLNLI